MLVYHKDAMGYSSIDDKRVYGEYFSYGKFGPTEITYEQFCKNRDLLLELPITGEWLSSKFNKKFPECAFKYTEMRKLDFSLLIEIAQLLGIDYRKTRYPSSAEKRALKSAVIKIIDQGV